jgi:hypothetical protein
LPLAAGTLPRLTPRNRSRRQPDFCHFRLQPLYSLNLSKNPDFPLTVTSHNKAVYVILSQIKPLFSQQSMIFHTRKISSNALTSIIRRDLQARVLGRIKTGFEIIIN